MKTASRLTAICLAIVTMTRVATASLPSSNLVLWLSASAGVEEATGDSAENNDFISAWLDQSGNNNDAFPKDPSGVVTNRHAPVFVTNAVNGLPAVLFTLGVGGAEYARLGLDSPLLEGSTDFHILSVVNLAQNSPTLERVIGGNYGVGNGGGVEFYSYQNGVRVFKGGSVVANTSIVDGDWHLVEAQRTGTTVTIWIDGVLAESGTLANLPIGTNRNWTIGNAPDYAALNFGYMAEQIVYSRGLTGGDHNQVVRRMADNYNLAIIPEPSALVLLSGAMLLRLHVVRRRA